MEDAAATMPGTPPGELYERFLAWLPDADLPRKNRKILAERQHWPAGALETCDAIEDHHPAWHISYLIANPTPGFARPAGYHAVHRVSRTEVFALTVDALIDGIEQTPPRERWSSLWPRK